LRRRQVYIHHTGINDFGSPGVLMVKLVSIELKGMGLVSEGGNIKG